MQWNKNNPHAVITVKKSKMTKYVMQYARFKVQTFTEFNTIRSKSTYVKLTRPRPEITSLTDSLRL